MHMKALLTVAMISLLATAAGRAGTMTDRATLLSLWKQENFRCSGPGNDPRTDAACAARQTYVEKLHDIGWCLGKIGQIHADWEWHKCVAGSYR
jgi:hypothetical protein